MVEAYWEASGEIAKINAGSPLPPPPGNAWLCVAYKLANRPCLHAEIHVRRIGTFKIRVLWKLDSFNLSYCGSGSRFAVAGRTSHVNTKLRRPCFASAAQRLSDESLISKQRRKTLTLKKWTLNVLGQQAWLITVVDFNPWNWRCAWRHAWHFELARKFNQSAARLFAIQSLSSDVKTKRTWRTISHSKLNMPSQIVLLASFARIISPKIASE